jgi:carboxyl-terminal processing protease
MKKILQFTLLLFLLFFTFQSCQDMDDVAAPNNLSVQNFIWKGLNLYYLWQADVPNLADDRFENQGQLNAFLKGYPVPEDLFDALRVDKTIDRFSWIVPDYLVLEQELQGTSLNNGVDFGLTYKKGSTTELVGFVRYILPNSDASKKEIKRGDIFYAVNGSQLTINNYQSLLAGNNYTINFANLTYDSNNNPIITPNGKTVTLTKTTLDENPIFINKVIENGSHKIGYLMYNGFYSNYDTQLNDAFGVLKSQNITELILDLRYNSGGSIQSATRLASMITGAFTGKVFAKQQWNAKINTYFESKNPETLNDNFVDKIGNTAINNLNLTKIYILTSKGTASASELIINGLVPYMDVIQIGDYTTGKNVGSITLYDSPTFTKTKRNPSHRYAMQPIVLRIVNANGFGDYLKGLKPTYELKEYINTLGILGNSEIKMINSKEELISNEPLLDMAFAKITGRTTTTKRTNQSASGKDFIYFDDSKFMNALQNQMYLEKVPEGLFKSLE